MDKAGEVAGRLRTIVLILGAVLFVGSLFLPGIVFRPDARANPKAGECGFAVQDGVMCSAFAFGGSGMTSCERVQAAKPGRSYVDRQKILDYCKGWDAPVAAKSYGYTILLTGFAGAFVGVFAWFANPLMLLALALAKFRRRIAAIVVAAAAVVLGLQAFMLEAVPFNEASMKPDNLDYVDHLGPGFYVWMAALVAFAAFCFLNKEDGASGG